MTLINVLDEITNSINGNDTGVYQEERYILKQLGYIIPFEVIHNKYIESGAFIKADVQRTLEEKEEIERLNNEILGDIKRALYDLIPEENKANDFSELFEQEKSENLNDRISRLQITLVDYLEAKSKTLGDDIILPIEEYEDWFIKEDSFVLSNPEVNMGLDEAYDYFKEVKKRMTIGNDFSVK